MSGPTSDYHRGEMNIAEQTATFHAVMGMTKWGSLTVAVGVLFATLFFCTGTGFIGSFVAAVILTVIGVVALKEKPASH